jgi:hypothetical protein
MNIIDRLKGLAPDANLRLNLYYIFLKLFVKIKFLRNIKNKFGHQRR